MYTILMLQLQEIEKVLLHTSVIKCIQIAALFVTSSGTLDRLFKLRNHVKSPLT